MLFKRPKQETLPGIKPPEKKEKKKERKKGSRWPIVGLFIFTVLASLVFYLKTEAPKVWQRITAPIVISTLPEEKRFEPSPVLAEIESLTQGLSGTYGLYVYRFQDENEYGRHQNEVFPAASLIKLPVILALYQQAEKGEISLESKYALVERDKVVGAGVLQGQKVGTVYTYRQLAEYMGRDSDNTAFRAMRRILGDKVIEEAIKNLGMAKTSLKKNETTPQEIGLLFKKLYLGKIVSGEHKEEILGFLTKTSFEDRIPVGVPEEVRVAHKIGTETNSFSDAGIVFADEPLVLVVMSKGARESEAKEVLPKITRAVWEFENPSL